MKAIWITLMGAATIGAALPALAGPDWNIIEQARKAKLVRLQQQAAAQPAASSGTSATQTDEARRRQMMKDCQEMMKRSS